MYNFDGDEPKRVRRRHLDCERGVATLIREFVALLFALAAAPAAAKVAPAPTSTPAMAQSVINSIAWVNGKGPWGRQAVHDNLQALLNGTGMWDASGRFSPKLNAAGLSAALGSNIIPQVANNAGIARVTSPIATVNRTGFAYSGDGGEVTLTHSASPCSFNQGRGDGGSQVPDAAGTGCYIADLTKPVSAAVWGVKSDCATDDQPAWSAAIKAIGTMNGGGTLLMPARRTCSKLNRTLSIQFSSVRIEGAGPDASFFGVGFPTGNGIEIGGNPASSTYTKNVSLRNLAVNALVSRTAGAQVAVYRALNADIRSLRCTGAYWICRATDGTLNGQEDTLDTEDSFLTAGGGQIGMCIGCLYNATSPTTAAASSGATSFTLSSTAGMVVGEYANTPLGANGAPGAVSNVPITAITGKTITLASGATAALASGTPITAILRAPVSTVIHHAELTNHNGPAEQLQNTGGLVQDDINTDFNYYGLLMTALPGQAVSGVFTDKSNFDAQAQYGILAITNGGGLIYSNVFTATWVASCGSPITQGIVAGTSASDCVRMTGPANTIFDMQFHFAHVGAAGQHCIEMDASARDISLSGNMSSCGFFNTPGAYQGIYSNGATHWSWNGTIGTATTVPGIYPQNQQYNIYMTGATDYVRISGDLGRDHSGIPIFNNATGTNFSYDGVLPALPWVEFTPAITCGSGAPGSGAVASMHYQQRGKTVNYSAQIAMGTSSTCVGMKFSLPFAPAFNAVGTGVETANTVKIGGFAGIGATSALIAGNTTAPTQYFNAAATGGNNTSNTNYVFSGTYEMQ